MKEGSACNVSHFSFLSGLCCGMVVAVNYELSGHGEDTDAVFSDVVSGCQLTACLPARVGHVLNNQLWNVFPFSPPPPFPVSPSSSIQYRCLFSSLSACFALDPPPLRITRLQWWSSVFSCRKPLNHGCLPSLCTCFRTPYNH